MKVARESEQKWTAKLLQGTKIKATRATRSYRYGLDGAVLQLPDIIDREHNLL